MTVLEILRGARELIATPERWTKGHGARDQGGEPAAFDEEKACRWCIWGAMAKITDGPPFDDSLAHAVGFEDSSEMFDWNDIPTRTHAEVLARLDAAIQAEEAKASHG